MERKRGEKGKGRNGRKEERKLKEKRKNRGERKDKGKKKRKERKNLFFYLLFCRIFF